MNRSLGWVREGKYERLAAEEFGVWKSPGFPGLWLDGPATIGGDSAAVFAALTRGLASPDRAAFVERLQSGR